MATETNDPVTQAAEAAAWEICPRQTHWQEDRDRMEATILSHILPAVEAATKAAVEAEQARWQERFNQIHIDYGVDGSGCDSGDPLDLTETKVRLAIRNLMQDGDALCERVRVLTDAGRTLIESQEENTGTFREYSDRLHAAWDAFRAALAPSPVAGATDAPSGKPQAGGEGKQ